jgi:spermidine/putrescine ABC transporter ATP-binding subunit
MSEPLVLLDDIRKTFGKTVAVDNLDMRIDAGEFVTFLGPSGCGKTTTLRMLGGFERPDKGRIVLDGQDVTRLAPNERNVNMVFQDYALFPHLTVRRNIAFGLELKRMTASAIENRIAELASFLELEAYIDRYPDQLSGGQRQRVALARALAPDPALLLLDEPLAALDAKLRGQVQQELKAIQRRTGKTFFFVTHDQDEAMTMSDRIVVMNEGKVEQDGTPQQLYDHPQSRFVAEFVGETNLIEARLEGRDGEATILSWNDVTLRAEASNGAFSPGSPVAASLRLENVTLASTPTNHDNVIEGRIINPVFKGSRTVTDIELAGRPATTLRAYIDRSRLSPEPGTTVFAGFDAANVSILHG